jgi:hypothetical protein
MPWRFGKPRVIRGFNPSGALLDRPKREYGYNQFNITNTTEHTYYRITIAKKKKLNGFSAAVYDHTKYYKKLKKNPKLLQLHYDFILMVSIDKIPNMVHPG